MTRVTKRADAAICLPSSATLAAIMHEEGVLAADEFWREVAQVILDQQDAHPESLIFAGTLPNPLARHAP